MPLRHGGDGLQLPSFLTLALHGGEWSASHSMARSPGTQQAEG